MGILTYNGLSQLAPSKFKPNKQHPMYPKLSDDEDDLEQFHEPYLSYYEEQFSSSLLKIYLDEPIREPKYYRGVVSKLAMLSENDQVEVYLSTVGGRLDGALSIIGALANTPAEVTRYIDGECHSAGSLIALNGDNIAVSPYATMMIHGANFGSAGHQSNVVTQSLFTDKQIRKLMQETYQGFLTQKEIDEVLSGQEKWFDSDEIIARLQQRSKYLEAQHKKLVREQQKQAKQKVKSEVAELED